jgi:RNA polymerase sigma-70 factor, ECF subfamily
MPAPRPSAFLHSRHSPIPAFRDTSEFRNPNSDLIPTSAFRIPNPVPTGMPVLPSIPCVTDAELVEQARRGDTAAFGELVMRHQAAVIRAARVVCRSHEEAEDVAQEAFVTAWTRLDGYRGEAQFRTWLLTIAWRRALSRRESVWRRLRRTVSTDEGAYREPATAARGADERLADEALVKRLRELVGRLPLRLRAPLLLTASGDWTYDEMAAALGVPSGTLKWRVMEARRRLKSQLEAEGFGGL